MSSKSDSHTPRGLIPWKKRATFKVAKSQRARRKQYHRQTNIMLAVIGGAAVIALVFMLINWRNAGATKAVSCAEYPQYCVPLAGGAASSYTDLEAADVRELDEESHGAPGVVRYVDEGNIPTIGDPDAPVHFRTVSSFTCGHCNNYHTGDLERFIEDYVLTGQATLGFVLAAGDTYAVTASLGGLCAGEQGAFWEMSNELFRLARAGGASAFTLIDIQNSADDMSLDDNALASCMDSGRYYAVLDQHRAFASDYGVSVTPTLLVRFEGDADWTRLDGEQRVYSTMAAMTEQANAVLGN